MDEHADEAAEDAPSIQLLIFDLEVLLEDARPLRARSLAAALVRLAAERGLDLELPDETALDLLASNVAENLDLLGPELDADGLARLLVLVQEARVAEAEAGQIQLSPQVAATLEELHDFGYKVAIVSQDSREFMLGLIDYFELDRYIDLAVCSGDSFSDDPSQVLLEVLENQEVMRSEAVFVSNRAEALNLARSLLLYAVGGSWGGASPAELRTADRIVESPDELVEWLLSQNPE